MSQEIERRELAPPLPGYVSTTVETASGGSAPPVLVLQQDGKYIDLRRDEAEALADVIRDWLRA